MKMRLALAATLMLGAAMVATTEAQATDYFAGDEDCFGLGGSCAVGDLFRDGLGGSFFTDYSTGSDPLGTDVWDVQVVSVDIALGSLPSLFSATLEIFFAGLELAPGGTVFVNGTAVGPIQVTGTDSFQKVGLATYSGIEALLTANTNVTIMSGDVNDGYIVDYVKLSIDAPPVPLPAALPLLAAGLGGLAFLRRRAA